MRDDLNPYCRYYDLLHQGKDYAGEIETVLGICRSCGVSSPGRALDVGCGTGNHSIELARRGLEVVGVDIDEEIISIARRKGAEWGADRLRFVHGRVETLSDGDFDLAVAMFNVVNYVLDGESVISFFRAIGNRVRGGGIFVFDAINGVAALRDPARRKESQVEGPGGEQLRVVLTPTTDFFNELLRLTGEVEVEESGKDISYRYSFQHRLWTPRVLSDALETAGFRVVTVCRWMQPATAATADDWKIMFVCRRRQEN